MGRRLSAPIAARTRRTRLAIGCFVPPDVADADGRTGCQQGVFRLAVASGLLVHGRSGGRRAGGVPKTSLRRSHHGAEMSRGYRVPARAFHPSHKQMISERTTTHPERPKGVCVGAGGTMPSDPECDGDGSSLMSNRDDTVTSLYRIGTHEAHEVVEPARTRSCHSLLVSPNPSQIQRNLGMLRVTLHGGNGVWGSSPPLAPHSPSRVQP